MIESFERGLNLRFVNVFRENKQTAQICASLGFKSNFCFNEKLQPTSYVLHGLT